MQSDENLNPEQKKIQQNAEYFADILKMFFLYQEDNILKREEIKKLKAENQLLKQTQSPVFNFGTN